MNQDGSATPSPRDGEINIGDAGTVLKPNFSARAKNNNRNSSETRSPRSGGSKTASRRREQPRNRYAPKRSERTKTEELPPIVWTNDNTLRIIPLGGSAEIGEKNMYVYEYNNDIVVVDAGLQFADASMPGVDFVVCDTTYLEQRKNKIRAFVVTHGHEDHIGGFPFIWPKFRVPIYTAPLTAGLIKAKFEEHGIDGYEFRIIQPNDKVRIGGFVIEPVRITHSIPDILGLAITAGENLVYHVTDWKMDHTPPFGEPTDMAKLTELAARGITVMLSDSTNVLEPGHSISEKVVADALEKIFHDAKGRIVVSSFSSRIDRIQHVVTACSKTNRRLAVSGRSMERNINIAMELGYLKVPENLLIDIRNINTLPDHQAVVMCTGSQGEEFSALVRMAAGEHRHIHIKRGDTVVLSSKPIPGNERGIDQTINNLYRNGAEVITNKELDVHSSGHAHREEIKEMLALLKPKYLIPIHGDFRRFVEHGKLAVTVGLQPENALIIENGMVAEFKDGNGRISEKRVPVGMVMIDGLGVGDIGEIVIRDRQTMAKDGLFLTILTIDKKTGKLLTSPDIISRGFVYMKDSAELIDGARAIARRLHARYAAKKPIAWDLLKKSLRDEVGDYLYKKTNRNPMVISAVIQV